MYAFGFTESAGNFQQNNFGKGGVGNDAVLADAQDGSGTNNANFSTPADGSPGRMQMYIFTGPTPHRDGDVDMEIVFHEHTHGLSNRLVGGGVGISQLQTQGMGEGWSDFYSLCLLSQPGDDVNGCYAEGGYATYQLSGLTQNYYYGIRRYPYTTDMTKNPLTLKDIDPTVASAHATVPHSPIFSAPNVNPSEVHNQGEVWCVTLWDVRANLVNKLGAVAGNNMVIQIVTDGMKLSPANPTFLQARDGIIQADLVDNGGANRNELWAAFAKRGMGASATVPVNSTTTGVVEAFDLPDALSVNPTTAVAVTGAACGPFAPASQIYTLTNNSTTTPLYWTAAPSQPWMAVSPAGGTLAAGASISVTMAFTAAANSLAAGTYNGTVNFLDATSGVPLPRAVTLTVGGTTSATALRMAIPSVTTVGAGVLTGQGSVSIASAQASALVVSLASSNSAEAAVPASVTIPAGLLSATFNVTIGNDAILDGTQNAIITATASGFTGAAQVIAVQDNELATLTLSAPASTTEGAGTIQGTLTVSTAPASPVTVTLTSSDTTALQVPSAVVIPAGQTSISVPITVVDDNKINGTHSATVTAHVGNWTDGTATVSIADNETTNLAIALPASVTEGGIGTGTVSISGTFPSAVIVSLSSNNTSRLTVPATVTIPIGSTSATFTLTAPNNTLTDGSATVTITASATGFTGTSGTTTVLDDDVHHYTIAAVPSPQTRGVAFSVTITAQDVNGVTIASYAGTPALSATGTGGAESITPPAAAAFTGGVWTGNVTVNTFDTNVVLTVSDGSGHTGSSNSFNVGVGALHHFGWNTVASPRATGTPFASTVTAQDAGNNTVTGFTGTANLSGYVNAPSAGSIVITEINPNTPDEIEFMNVGAGPVDISGWTIYIYDFDTGGTAPKTFAVPAGTTCAAGQLFRLQEFGTAPGAFPLFFYGANINWTSDNTSTVGVLLRDAGGNMVDFVCAGALAASAVTSPAAIPASQWSGAQIAGPTNLTFGYARQGSTDRNTAADWITATPSMGTVNPGLSTPFTVQVAVPISPTVSGIFVSGIWTGNIAVLQATTAVILRAADVAGHTGDSNAFNVTGTTTVSGNPQSLNVSFNTAKPIVLTGQDSANGGATLTYSIYSTPAHGTLTGTAPNVTCTPAAGYNGADSFTFIVSNGTVISAPATVSLTVAPGTPTALPQSLMSPSARRGRSRSRPPIRTCRRCRSRMPWPRSLRTAFSPAPRRA